MSNRIDISNRYAKSNAMLERAEQTIPLGSQTFSKSRVQYPVGASPLFIDRGNGARVWDIDGNEYVDLVCGLLPVVLGYCDPDIDTAIQTQLKKGISFSLATPLEVDLAERLREIIPCAEMTRFGKNGSDATSAAVRLARAATGRDHVVALGYHGWHDWYIGATTRSLGVPSAVRELTHKVAYNDLDAMKKALDEREVAAVIIEPAGIEQPKEGYLQAVLEMTREAGTLLVFDEIITGFRFALGGAQSYFGVIPDLAAFGKSMGNGMPISAIVGRADLMHLMEDIFFSGTFGGEALSLAASIAVIDKMKREPVIDRLWKSGATLKDGVEKIIESYGLSDTFKMAGLPCFSAILIGAHPKARKEVLQTLFQREMLRNGVLMTILHNVCYALTDADIGHVLRAYETTMATIVEELVRGDIESRLGCAVIEPVFRVRG
jgi:glutamate-1-semialdehyde 2,1-aminomutase